MGIDEASKFLHRLSGLSWDQLKDILGRRRDAHNKQRKKTVAVDMSWIICKLGTKSTVKKTLAKVEDFLGEFLSKDIRVIAVFDPSHRHHSKKATIVRGVKTQRNMLDAISHKTQLLAVTSKIRNETNPTKLAELKEQQRKLSKLATDCENKVAERQNRDVVHLVRDHVDKMQQNQRDLSIITGAYQADSVIQHLSISKEIDVVIGNDSDFSFVAGGACVQITDFKLLSSAKKKKKSPEEVLLAAIKIATPSLETMKECLSAINRTLDESGRHLTKIEPVVSTSLSDKEVKRRTGFRSMFTMLAFISVVCDGDTAKMEQNHSRLTWFEEWFLYFEILWGRTLTRWEDVHPAYNTRSNDVVAVFREKLTTVIEALNRWPTYATQEEDKDLRSEHWEERYGDRRVVMWDNTNIDFQGKPTDAELQRRTYSHYYGGNVAKGGIFIQLCGWLGAGDLWLGAVSDSDYLERSGVLGTQRKFMEWDPQFSTPFTNILDKGYRSVMAAWRAGGQLLLQPSFASSDQKFLPDQVQSSACVAADRAANERAVKRLKMSGYLMKGIHPRQDLAMTADVWLAWGFQCNFMYEPVLQ